MKPDTDEIENFDQRCIDAWGAPLRSHKQVLAHGIPRIKDFVQFDQTSNVLKIHIAEKLLLESSPHVGSVTASVDVQWYLRNVAHDLQHDVGMVDYERVQPLKSALLLTVIAPPLLFMKCPEDDLDLYLILNGGAAPAALYLLSQLEYLFRVKGQYLDKEGQAIRKIPPQLCRKAGLSMNQTRISQIKQAFLIYLYRNPTPLAKRLGKLERRLKLSKRLARIRNPAMHGPLPDIAVEGRFYGFLISMFYYAECQERPR